MSKFRHHVKHTSCIGLQALNHLKNKIQFEAYAVYGCAAAVDIKSCDAAIIVKIMLRVKTSKNYTRIMLC